MLKSCAVVVATATKEEQQQQQQKASQAVAVAGSGKKFMSAKQEEQHKQQKPTSSASAPHHTKAESLKALFTREEVATHNTEKSCWLIVGHKVYDVTPFLHKHPAGANSILRHAGTDATEDFNFHSKSAQRLWDKYLIGRLEGEDKKCLLM
ncbi:fatty acid alpha-hydroxylase [Balamuthia mandrillaris]